MATEMEDLAMMRVVEGVADQLWEAVSAWDMFGKDTLGKQLIRAADSIGANIAEGYGRFNYGEKAQFLYYARGSLFETKYWLNRAFARKLITSSDHALYAQRLTDIARQINSYTRYLKGQRHQKQSSGRGIGEERADYLIKPIDEPSDFIFSDTDLELLSRL